MRVLVTGSSGYLASLILPRLAADPAVEQVVGLDVRPSPGIAGLRHRQMSILDPGLAEALRAEAPDVVLHLAWIFNPSHDREGMRRVDVDGTRLLLEAAAACRVPRLIYLGSTTSYGAWPDNPERLGETCPARGNPDFPYSADKAEVERLLDRFEPAHPDLAVTRLRPCIVLGRRADNFVRALIDMPVLLRARGHDPELQFLHEDDLADCVAMLVSRPLRGAYNLAPEETVRLSEIPRLRGRRDLPLPGPLLHALVAAGWHTRLLGVPPSYLAFVKWPWLADTRKLREATGFSPRRTSREAVLTVTAGPDTGEGG